jgi:MFS family permease
MSVPQSQTYRALLRRPGIVGLLTSAMIGRLASGMVPFGAVAAFTDQGRPALAGFAFAIFLIGVALTGPWRGRLVDRRGAGAVLPGLSVAFTVLVIIAAATLGRLPVMALAALGLAACLAPPNSAVLRSVWTATARTDDENRALHSLDSVLEEVVFVISPLLTSAIWVTAGSRWALVVGAVAALAGTGLLVTVARTAGNHVWDVFQGHGSPPDQQPGATSSNRPRGNRAGIVRSRGGLALLLPMAGLGVALGATAVALPSWAKAHDSAAFSGVLLAVISAAGVLTGLFYGVRRVPGSRWQQYSGAVLVTALGVAVIALAHAPALAVLGTILVGAGMTPMFVVAYLLVGDAVPQAQRTEANAALGSAYNLGSGAAAAAVGTMMVATSVPTALIAAAALTALTALAAILRPETTNTPATDDLTEPDHDPRVLPESREESALGNGPGHT